MAINYAARIRNAMKKMGTYRPEYEMAIGTLAQLKRQYDEITERFENAGMPFEVETETGSKKAPIVTTRESLRKDVLAYMGALGLTPAGARRLETTRAEQEDNPLEALIKRLDDSG